MPKDMMEMKDYGELLDKLADEYPELESEVAALSDKLMDVMPMEEEEGMLPGDMEAIPPELMDDEEMDEEELELGL